MIKIIFFHIILILEKFFPTKAIPVLAYHKIDESGSGLSVSQKNFEEQLKYLKQKNYKTISPEQLEGFLSGQREAKGREVVITFDDGFKDNAQNALPILNKYGFKAIFFIATKFIGQESIFCSKAENKKFAMMNAEELKILVNAGNYLANHFHSHTDLIKMDDSEIRIEYDKSSLILRSTGEKNIFSNVISYPHNKKDDRIISLIRKIGIKLAFGGRRGLAYRSGDNLDLPRIEIYLVDNMTKFKAKLSRFYYFFNK